MSVSKLPPEQLPIDAGSILDAAGEGIYCLDREGVTTFANPAAARLTGHAVEELVGCRWHELVHHSRPDGTPCALEQGEAWQAVQAGRLHSSDQDVYWRSDGTTFAVEHTSTPVVEHGEFKGAVVLFKDISERKQAEQALAAGERETRQILETAHDAFIATDERGLIRDCNPQAEAIFGWAAAEMLGREMVELIIPEADREAHRRRVADDLASGEGPVIHRRHEQMALHRDGREFPVEMAISVFHTDTGCSLNVFLRNITERKAAEELLVRQRRQLLTAQSVVELGSWEWDVAADAIEWSAQLYRIYGLEPRDDPRSFEDLLACMHPDDRADVEAQVQSAFASGEPFSFEHRIVRPDEVVRTCHARGEVIRGEDGAPARVLGTEQDVTERRQTERAKDEFTSVVSHELRTPLTSIRGSLGLLESGVLGRLPEKGQRMVEIAVQNTDRLIRLINDILDIERIGAGAIDMHPQLCDAQDLIERACEGLVALAADAQVSLTIEGEPVALVADPDRILQTLTNLISNAVKFSSAGGSVRVSCARRNREVLFEVVDEGRGIPPDKLELIFDRFQQVDTSDSRAKGGTGLGLAISRTIVEHHGGSIWAASELGAGSSFSFVLPARSARALQPPARADGGATVLVCDGDPSVVEVLTAMLEQRGYRALSAHSGEQVLALAQSERPDAIMLDSLIAAGAGGGEIVAALKCDPQTGAIPIVILSSLSRAEADEPGVSVAGWLQKPIYETELFAALGRATGGRERPFQVLIVEDDPDLAGILMTIFESHGVETFHVADGLEAIRLSQQVLPDMLVLDVGLPGTDGFEVVEWLRRHERLSALPMVVYTARDLNESDRERLRLGVVTEFMTKAEISPQQFEQRVMALLTRLTRTGEAVGGHVEAVGADVAQTQLGAGAPASQPS